MSVEKVYKCDLCGEFRERPALMRLGVRGLDDRPEDADNVDVCADCHGKPVSDVMAVGLDMRRVTVHGQ